MTTATASIKPLVAGHAAERATPVRLQSLDALRGFDMFWIMSGERLVHALADTTQLPWLQTMSAQLEHTPWNGFTFYDMIFPLFIFIAGVSMPFAYSRQLEKTGIDRANAKRNIYRSLLQRTLILILLGMVVNGLLRWQGYEQTRFASVLGRIAIACFFAALIYLNTGLKGQLLWFTGLLLGYWAMMTLVPVPGYGAGVLTPEGNLEAWIDRLLLPGRLYNEVYDPEGILSSIPAVGTALLGVFAGRFLRLQSSRWTPSKKALALAAAGLASLGIALLWNLVFPINKHIWTSSFVLYAGGWSLLLLALFYGVIDVAGLRKWSLPFVWIGMNSIFIYMATHGIINFRSTAETLFGGLIKFAPEAWQPVWLAAAVIAVQLALLYFLYRKKWFLKV